MCPDLSLFCLRRRVYGIYIGSNPLFRMAKSAFLNIDFAARYATADHLAAFDVGALTKEESADEFMRLLRSPFYSASLLPSEAAALVILQRISEASSR
jgi:hypothetical protein